MTRSIFDPTSGQTERSGSRFTGPDAENISHMPPDVVDGNAEGEAEREAEREQPAPPDQAPPEDQKDTESGSE